MSKTIFDAIASVVHDEDFRPNGEPVPTSAPPGTQEKLRVLAERVRLGMRLWHEGDGTCEGSIGHEAKLKSSRLRGPQTPEQPEVA